METPANHPSSGTDQPSPEHQAGIRFDAANDFLDTCDRLSTGYESGFYWEDVQRALRIASGLEKWPD